MDITTIRIDGFNPIAVGINPGDTLADAMENNPRIRNASKYVWNWSWSDGGVLKSSGDPRHVPLRDEVDILGSVAEALQTPARVHITVPGCARRTVKCKRTASLDGVELETISNLISRLKVRAWSETKITEWWVDGVFLESFYGVSPRTRDGMSIIGTAVRAAIGVKMARVMIVGCPLKHVPLRENETLSGLASRISSGSFPTDKVDSWYLDGTKVLNPNQLIPRNGDLIAGTPRVHGS